MIKVNPWLYVVGGLLIAGVVGFGMWLGVVNSDNIVDILKAIREWFE